MSRNNKINDDLQFAGTITGTKGYDGRMRLKGTPEHILTVREGAKTYIGFSKNFTSEYIVTHWKKTKKESVFSVRNIENKEEAIKLKEQAVFIFENDIITEQDESYSVGTLLDCFVYDITSGKKIGKIKDVYILPANDVWIVETDEGELPIPFIEDVVKKVDIDNSIIEIEMIEGLQDLIAKESDEQ